MYQKLKNFLISLVHPPSCLDVFVLSVFVVLILWHPFYLHQKINLFELGLYLPGIDAILSGQIPYRDFFYLRGPFELYLPAILMKIFGTNAAVLSTYFYVGTILTLIACVVLLGEILPLRLLLYVAVPVLIARTFPRVVFTYWGGMRYAWGLLAVWCAVRFLKEKKSGWLVAAGILTAVAGLTSLEMGACTLIAVVSIILWLKDRLKNSGIYIGSTAVCVLFYFIYLWINGALIDYLHSQWIVATQMTTAFPQTELVPSNFYQFLHSLFVVSDENFRHMTPVYCYMMFVFYVGWRFRSRQINVLDQAASIIAVYGLMLYVTGFRNLWASVFEMSLQPEKIVLFYLLARGVEYLLGQSNRRKWGYALLVIIVISSLSYSAGRFAKRFLFFARDPLKGQPTVRMDMPRLKGMVLPQTQAQDILELNNFLSAHTKAGEVVWMYSELGAMHFILNRPWVGKFSIPTLSWIDDDWHAQYIKDLKEFSPRYLITYQKLPGYFEKSHLAVAANRKKFDEEASYIQENYSVVSSTPEYYIYAHR